MMLIIMRVVMLKMEHSFQSIFVFDDDDDDDDDYEVT